MTPQSPAVPVADPDQITATEVLGLLAWRMAHPGTPVPRLLCADAQTLEQIRQLSKQLIDEVRQDETLAATAREAGDLRARFFTR